MVGVEAFTDWVELDSWPMPTCPECGRGLLVGQEDLAKARDRKTKGLQDSEQGIEPEWIRGSISGFLTCNNDQCGEVVTVSGTWHVGYGGDPEGPYVDRLRAMYFDPPLQFIDAPKKTPPATTVAIRDASQLLLINPSAAANRLRQGVEALLDARRIQRTTARSRKDGSVFRARLSLHERIVIFRNSHRDIADLLEAVKWIGNDGSHELGLSADQVLVGARILEVALKRLYEPRDAVIEKEAQRIIRNRGIRARRS